MLAERWLLRGLLGRLVRGLLSALSGVVNVGFGVPLIGTTVGTIIDSLLT